MLYAYAIAVDKQVCMLESKVGSRVDVQVPL